MAALGRSVLDSTGSRDAGDRAAHLRASSRFFKTRRSFAWMGSETSAITSRNASPPGTPSGNGYVPGRILKNVGHRGGTKSLCPESEMAIMVSASSPKPVPRPGSGDAELDDAALVRALRSGAPSARARLFDRYAPHMLRILTRVMGSDPELPDLLHEVFARALAGVAGLRSEDALTQWMTGIAVLTGRECIRRRARRRWLSFFADEEVPEVEGASPNQDTLRAVAATYAALDKLGADERIVFALRVIDGMELAEIAAACGVSLNTIKRRLVRAEKRFVALARQDPWLESWIKGGSRWSP
jgi:RNA polymerase sigma-70 factor (ECF subfamily)